jgi:hypothetical protein
VHGFTPTDMRPLRDSRVIIIGLRVALRVQPVHSRQAQDRLDDPAGELRVFSALLLCDVCEGTHAIGCALLHQLDIWIGNGVVCECNIKCTVVPIIFETQSRREADVHVPMVITALLRGILVYLDGAKPFYDLFSPSPNWNPTVALLLGLSWGPSRTLPRPFLLGLCRRSIGHTWRIFSSAVLYWSIIENILIVWRSIGHT